MSQDDTRLPDEPERLDASASASDHLAAGPPAVDIGGATRPRTEDEIQFVVGDENRKPVESKPGDPLDGIPSVPADVTGEVPESQVTDSQGESVTSGEPSGSTEHPPASSGL